ncbi:MAG: S8 family peptidase [Defluviitaleaceae bacterium]|nr:S8 family peptidase [Defluviitaleaceae bacterium]
MANENMSPEDFINAPTTVALVLPSVSVTKAFLENHMDILFSKPLTGGYIIAYVNENDVDKVVTNAVNYSTHIYPVVLGLLGADYLASAGILQVHRQPFLTLRGSGVLLGFISTGIDYRQKTFQYEDGTSKIQYIWDQSIRGNPPADYHYGSEYNNETINRALKSENPLEVVPHADTVGHGTFLASVAGGREMDGHIGAAPDAEIIAVKLKRARPLDYARYLIPRHQENAFSSDDFILGVQYIIDKAIELKRPVAICVSLGTNQGGHDGFNILEEYLAKVSNIQGTAVCAAAGNEANAGHHTQGRIAATGASEDIEVRISDKQEDVYLTVWNYASDRMSVSVKSPTGEQVSRIPARSGVISRTKLVLERSTVIVDYIFPIETSGGQVSRVRILSATPGIWTITVYGDSILDGTFHSWLPIVGFIDPDTRFISPKPNYTIVLPATSLGVITCGAYNSKDNSLYDASSWGPTRLPAIKPDLTAPGVDVSGISSIGPGTMSGTSVSAAITAGACALMLQWGVVEQHLVPMNSYRVRAKLIAGCDRNPGVEYPNYQWGYGRLNLLRTFQAMRS